MSLAVRKGEIPMIAAASLPPIPFLLHASHSSSGRFAVSTNSTGVYSSLMFSPADI